MKFEVEQIRRAILETGESINQLAQRAGVSCACLRRAVNGKRLQILTALKIAKSLKLSI